MGADMDRENRAVLESRGLRRSYGRFRRVEAVRGVSFTVRPGEVFGLIGPDGAGKTSIIQMLAGVLGPHAGAALVDGLDVATDAERVKQRVGYMPQGLGSNLYDSLTVTENIEFFRDLRQLPADVYGPNRAELLAATRLEPFVDRRAATLSGGMRQKLALICALIHLPAVLLLDEPTTGVDPISRQDFWQIIRRIGEERGTTVLLSTSYMDEAERCHRIALMHRGLIVAEGTPEAVRRRATGHFARLVAEPQSLALAILHRCPGVSATEVFGDDIHIHFDGELSAIAATLTNEGVAIRAQSLHEPGLDDVFLQLVGTAEPADAAIHFDAGPPRDGRASVECRGVTCQFGAFTAVRAVELSVPHGEIFGLLGPNGAGKTTLIKMMCGLLAPTTGSIVIGGVNVVTDRARAWTVVGYMSQRFSLYQDLSVSQNLQLFGDLYGVAESRYAPLIGRLGLVPYASRLTRDVPAGVRQRLSLLCAVLHRPPIVVLDEPTSGVDPEARRVFWDLIYSLSREAGITVFVSTHHMEEAAHCDRLGLMDQGRLIAVGSPSELTRISERRSGTLLAIAADQLWRAHRIVGRERPGAILYGERLHVRSLNPETDRVALKALLEGAGVGCVRIEPVPLSMDETFIDFINTAEAAYV
jgi:ABC-type multidrug transport system ATPase subunit